MEEGEDEGEISDVCNLFKFAFIKYLIILHKLIPYVLVTINTKILKEKKVWCNYCPEARIQGRMEVLKIVKFSPWEGMCLMEII